VGAWRSTSGILPMPMRIVKLGDSRRGQRVVVEIETLAAKGLHVFIFSRGRRGREKERK